MIRNVDSTVRVLKEALAEIDALDSSVDIKAMSDEEFTAYGDKLAELIFKINHVKAQLDPAFAVAEAEAKRFAKASQMTIFDYTDSDGSELEFGFETKVKETLNKDALDKLSGVNVSVTFSDQRYAPAYSKASTRRLLNKVKKLGSDGTITQQEYDSVVNKVTVEQQFFKIKTPSKDGNSPALIYSNPNIKDK